MRSLLGLLALALAACSGMPPETLVPLDGGQAAVGVTLAYDLQRPQSPDIGGWMGVGVGHGVDLAVGFDGPIMLVIGGPRMALAPLAGMLPGLAVRKTWPNGVSVGLGSSTRFDFATADSSSTSTLTTITTLGTIVSAGPPPGSYDGSAWAGGRATALVGYAWERGVSMDLKRHGLAVHASGQGGGLVARDDTVAAVVTARVQGGAFLLPRPEWLHGPALGLSVQGIERPGL